jgi:hypothetical protein
MKNLFKCVVTLSSIFALVLGCSDQTEKIPEAMPDRFASRFKDITEIADIRQLTDRKLDIAPFFSPSGDRIYFSRLIINERDSIQIDLAEASAEYFSIDYQTGQLYALEGIPEPPKIPLLPADSLPSMMTEKPVFGIRAGDAIYFTTESNPNTLMRNIYEEFDDSLVQLTFGTESSFLQLLSPDNRYMVFLYNKNHSEIVLYETQSGDYYVVPKPDIEKEHHDFAPIFSPDCKYMVFLRSGDKYKEGAIPFGDLWLIEFEPDHI